MRPPALFVLLTVLATTMPAAAADLFVDNVLGNDVRDGSALVTGQEGGPVKSLTRVLALARSGDRIVMTNTGVPYRESVTVFGGRNSGNVIESFLIEGNGAVLDGSLPVPPKAWESFRGNVFRFRPPRQAFAQLFLDGKPATRRYLEAHNKLPALEPHEWCLADGMIYFRVDTDALPDEYALSYAALPVGITLYQVHDAVIQDLVVQGFQLDGINAHDTAGDCELLGITARGNGRAGIAIGGASRVELVGCLVGDNGVAQLLCSGVSTTSLEDCQLLPNTAPALVRRGGKLYVDGKRAAD